MILLATCAHSSRFSPTLAHLTATGGNALQRNLTVFHAIQEVGGSIPPGSIRSARSHWPTGASYRRMITTGSNLTSALDQLHGEVTTAAHKVGFQLGDQFLNLMLDPFVDGRSGVSGADHPAFGLAPERESVPPAIALASASVLRASPKALPIYEPRWTVWAPISAVPIASAATSP